MDENPLVGAVILGAGRSTRMGAPKLILPWGKTTVIEQIVTVLTQSEVAPIVLVTGRSGADIRRLLRNSGVLFVHNPEYARTEMLESLQIGLRKMPPDVSACLVVLGDQPQIEHETVKKLLGKYRSAKSEIIVPSYQMRRGHPWLVDRSLWKEIDALRSPQSMRDFLLNRSGSVHYVDVFSNSVLMDLDTPDDYQNQRP